MAQNLTNEKLEKQHSVRRIPRHVAVKLAQCFTACFPAQRCSWFSHGHVTIQLIDCVLSLTDNTVIMPTVSSHVGRPTVVLATW